MTSSHEMTEDEIIAHGAAIAAAGTEDDFVKALSAYFKEVVEREADPYDKIALFVNGMLEGFRQARTRTEQGPVNGHVTRVELEPSIDPYRQVFVPACSCGWSGPSCYWSFLTPSIVDPLEGFSSKEDAKRDAEEQCTRHLSLKLRGGVPS